MQLISSTSNKLVKEIRALHTKKGRDKANEFLLEGANSIQEAIKDNINIKFIGLLEHHKPDSIVLNSAQKFYYFTEPAFKKACSTDTPTNIIAVCEKFNTKIDDIFNDQNKLIVILDEIKDPGNLGTIIRTACAANASGIIITDNSVDIFNPKVIRSTTGTLWKIPIVYHTDKSDLISKLKENHFKIYGADMHTETSYASVDYKQNTAIIFGSEAQGISDTFKASSDTIIKIPISNKVESLNVATSVAIILFEARKQKEHLNG